MGILLLTSCALQHLLDWDKAPKPQHVPLVSITDSVMKVRVDSARSWTVSTVKKIEEYWPYESHCGLFAHVNGSCIGTFAWRVDLQDGSRFYAFTPHGQYIPIAQGDTALFIFQRRVVFELQKCEEQQGAAGSAYCNYHMEDVLVSNYDLLPPSDSIRVAEMFKAKK